MKFTVVWRPFAEQQLSQLWLQANDRAGVSEAADRIDSLLQNDPQNEGESRGGGERILIAAPLAVLYRVSLDDRTATVWATWRIS